jgi:tRNA G18 (ribose-2'-O)-methylase SpoU
VNGTRYKHSQRTTAGSEKWLDVKVWTSTADCLRGLKKAGYQVVTTYLNAKSIPIQVHERAFVCMSLCVCLCVCV